MLNKGRLKMINLKRNSKRELTNATGLRTRKNSIYSPDQSTYFRISRSKFNDFITCKRCFYLDRVKGLISPSTPGWTLNETTDLLLKKEFDFCRERQIPHRSFSKFGLEDVVPFKHPDIEKWRDSLHHGLEYQVPGTNLILHGGVDDVWYHTKTKQVIVVDYKSQANRRELNQRTYLSDVYHESYKVQLNVYAYLLENMGFDVYPNGYFFVCNANRDEDGFYGKMNFEEAIISYQLDYSGIESMILKMYSLMNDLYVPESNIACENCAYARQRNSLGV